MRVEKYIIFGTNISSVINMMMDFFIDPRENRVSVHKLVSFGSAIVRKEYLLTTKFFFNLIDISYFSYCLNLKLLFVLFQLSKSSSAHRLVKQLDSLMYTIN